MGKDPDEIRQEIEETRGRMGETVDAIAYKADVPNRVQDAVNDRVQTMKSTITGTIGSVRNRVSSVIPEGMDVRDATMSGMNAVRENPLGLFFGCAAVGFLIGSLLPSTDIENERLGEMSDRLKQTAQTTGGQVLEQGKAVMKETIDAAQQSAMQHGSEIAHSAMDGMQ